MEHNSLPQIQEVLELIAQAKEYGIEMLERIEKLNSYATQIQGRNVFVKNCLKEQAQLFAILLEQNPEMEIFKSSINQVQEALLHSTALQQLNERSLEVLDQSANNTEEQEGITKASVLLKSVINCLDMLMGHQIKEIAKITDSNQNANQDLSEQNLANLKNHFKKG